MRIELKQKTTHNESTTPVVLLPNASPDYVRVLACNCLAAAIQFVGALLLYIAGSIAALACSGFGLGLWYMLFLATMPCAEPNSDASYAEIEEYGKCSDTKVGCIMIIVVFYSLIIMIAILTLYVNRPRNSNKLIYDTVWIDNDNVTVLRLSDSMCSTTSNDTDCAVRIPVLFGAILIHTIISMCLFVGLVPSTALYSE